MKKLILLSIIVASVTSCGNRKSSTRNNISGVNTLGVSVDSTYIQCSRYSFSNRCTQMNGVNRLLRPVELYDHRCYQQYRGCLNNGGL